jgi:hypothetical protein
MKWLWILLGIIVGGALVYFWIIDLFAHLIKGILGQ